MEEASWRVAGGVDAEGSNCNGLGERLTGDRGAADFFFVGGTYLEYI